LPLRLAAVLKAGGQLFMRCFSDEEPGTQGPRRVLRKEYDDAYSPGRSYFSSYFVATFRQKIDLRLLNEKSQDLKK
jgi:hypothetical protein